MPEIIELSQTVRHGEVTYPGLPAPEICDFWTREESAKNYQDEESFQIGKITMVANTGTYLDAPFHRYEDGPDLAAIKPESFAELAGICIKAGSSVKAIGREYFEGLDLTGKAVLVCTGWDKHWATEQYAKDSPYLTAGAAEFLIQQKVKLVGIDSINIDDIGINKRPVHSLLLAEGILIIEHMTKLNKLPSAGFTFHAAPAPVEGMGTFPVRAYAVLQ